MTATDFDPLETLQISASDRVFDALYAAVISVRLPPGTKVSEVEIAKQLGVSRQPVRDAFFRLSNLGFLSIRPQRATLITEISLRAVRDAVFTRTALEVECLRAAMAAPAALHHVLEENLEAHRMALTASTASFHSVDEAFHEAICTQAEHAHVWALIRAQKAHLDRIRYLTLSEERRQVVLREHSEIAAAVAANAPARAEAALRTHIEGVLTVLPAVQSEFPSYFEPV